MRRRANRRGFVPEVLEERTMLAGDVAAIVADGVLEVEGDQASNQLWMQGQGDGVVAVWGDATTVNGNTYDRSNPLVLTGVTGDVNVAMGAGHDMVFAYDIDAPADFNIDAGRGRNEVYVDRGSVSGAMSLDGGIGRDDFYVENVHVGQKLSLLTRGGSDDVHVSNTNSRYFFVHTARGNDNVYLNDINVRKVGRLIGGKGAPDYLGTNDGFDVESEVGEGRTRGFEEFGTLGVDDDSLVAAAGHTANTDGEHPNVMDVKLDQAITTLGRVRFDEQAHEQAIDEIMESLFTSNLVPLPTDTNGDQQDPDEQDFQEHMRRMDEAIDALSKHVNKPGLGNDNTKADAADARNFLQLTQEALRVIAGQTAFCNPENGEPREGIAELTGPGCQFLEANDEGGRVVDDVLQDIFSRQVRSPFPIIFEGDLSPNEVVINTGPLADGECAAAIKEFQGIKAVVTARQLPIWVEPWFSRARIVGFKTVWTFEFVPAEFIKTISVCNNGGSLETTVDSFVVHDRELMNFWRFIRN